MILPLLTPIVPWVSAPVLYCHLLAIPVLLSCAHAEQPLVGDLGLFAERLAGQVDVALRRLEAEYPGRTIGSAGATPAAAAFVIDV